MAVQFSIRDMVVEGQLAGVRPGDPRALVRTQLGAPDDWNADGQFETATLWRYGNFEVHFDGDVVWMLFNDYLDALDAGPGRTLDAWILRPSVPRPDAVLQQLRAENVPFVVGRDVLDRRVAWVEGGACLAFDRDEDDGEEGWFAIELLSPSRAPNFMAEPERRGGQG